MIIILMIIETHFLYFQINENILSLENLTHISPIDSIYDVSILLIWLFRSLSLWRNKTFLQKFDMFRSEGYYAKNICFMFTAWNAKERLIKIKNNGNSKFTINLHLFASF